MGCVSSRFFSEDEPEGASAPVGRKSVGGNSSSHSHENGSAQKLKSRQMSITKVSDDSGDRRKEQLGLTIPADTITGPSPSPRTGLVPKSLEAEQIAAGWPAWLAQSAGEAIRGWVPKRAESFEKLDKIGQGTYSNVYKARDLETGKLVALKKVRFDNLEPESVRFMAREIEVLRRLEHPNIVQLLGLVTSRMSCSLYLVFEYMEHDLAGLAACPGVSFTEPQVKCYMKQLLLGLEHCHTRGVLHRDIKGSNLLLDNKGQLKIADFGLATFYRPEENVPLTSRVVTLWYRPPELLLGATSYGVSVDLWSSGCILAELLAGKPIMPGRTEVEQLHKIFKLCGSPSEEYWRKSRLPHATIFKPTQPYKRCLPETFKDFPATSLALLEVLLAIDPLERGSATSALQSDFFTTKPLPCDPSSLPEYPPSKEYDAKLREEEARRVRAAGGRGSRGGAGNAHGADNKQRTSTLAAGSASGNLGINMAHVHAQNHRGGRAVPAPSANAEDPSVIAREKARVSMGAAARSKSDKFAVAAAEGGTYLPNQNLHPGTRNAVPGDIRGNEGAHAPAHRMAGGYHHLTKSGPQPMLVPKAGPQAGPQSGAPPPPMWALPKQQSTSAVAPVETDALRMAPPRMMSRSGKPISVPDFAIAGGYPDANGDKGTGPPPSVSTSALQEGEHRREKSQTSLQGEYSHSHSASYGSADFTAVEQETSTGESGVAWRQPHAGGYSGPLQMGRNSPGSAMGTYVDKSGKLVERKKWTYVSANTSPSQAPAAVSARSGNLEERRSVISVTGGASSSSAGGNLHYSERGNPSLPNGPVLSAAALAAKEGKRRYLPRGGGEGFEAEPGFGGGPAGRME